MKTTYVITKYLLSILITIALLMQFCLPILGAEQNNIDQYDYSEICTDFADDRVLVVLTQEESLKFLDYSPADFSEIGCTQVAEMTPFIVNKAREVITEGLAAIQNNVEPIIDTRLDLSGFSNILCLKLQEPGKDNVINAVNKLLERDDVLSAMPDISFTIDLESNANSASYTTWNKIDELIEYSNALEKFHNIYDSPDFDRKEVRVAVLDTGIDDSHPDFKYNLDEDRDANFCDYNGDGTLTLEQEVHAMTIQNIDNNGHGTHVAGIIAKTTDKDMWETSASDNLFGVVRFVSVKAFDENGEADATNIIAAINYINSYYGTSNEISVINFSASAIWNFTQFDKVNAINAAIRGFQGVFVCAAGNSGMNINGGSVYPAVLDTNNLITVGASDANDNICGFSNYGSETVDVFAPGYNILSMFLYDACKGNTCQTINNNEYADTHVNIDIDGDGVVDSGYHSLSGTSMATPFVSGVTALIYALTYNYSAAEIKNIIVESVDTITSMNGKCISGGRLNASNAVDLAIEMGTCNHSFSYSGSQTNLSSHTALCQKCSYTCTEGHSWSTYGTVYRCTKCLITSSAIPEIMQIPVDEEVLTASTDDPVAEDALLPNKEDDTATE